MRLLSNHNIECWDQSLSKVITWHLACQQFHSMMETLVLIMVIKRELPVTQFRRTFHHLSEIVSSNFIQISGKLNYPNMHKLKTTGQNLSYLHLYRRNLMMQDNINSISKVFISSTQHELHFCLSTS